jgi:hypothetical protein
MKASGCYAESGPLALFWRKVSEATYGTDWDTFLGRVAALPAGQAWRHNQAGDLPGIGDFIDAAKLEALTAASAGKLGWTYTHKPVIGAEHAANAAAVARANAAGFVVNLSADTLADADRLAALQIAPVVVVLDAPEGARADTVTPDGRKVITCPATYRNDISCGGGKVRGEKKGDAPRQTKACLICARQRKAIVGFPAHGTFKKLAASVARGES